MFINIVAKPEIGGMVWCYGNIKIVNKYVMMENIVGKVEEVGEDYVRLNDFDRPIPFYAVASFTFGGIRIRNRGLDKKRIRDSIRKKINDENRRRKSK